MTAYELEMACFEYVLVLYLAQDSSDPSPLPAYLPELSSIGRLTARLATYDLRNPLNQGQKQGNCNLLPPASTVQSTDRAVLHVLVALMPCQCISKRLPSTPAA